MSLLYLDQDTRDEIQRAADNGKSREFLAGQVGCSVPELCSLMGWPQWREIPADRSAGNMVQEPLVDLWRTSELDARL